jgi:hypothetical protein
MNDQLTPVVDFVTVEVAGKPINLTIMKIDENVDLMDGLKPLFDALEIGYYNKNDLSLIKLKDGRIHVEIDNEIPEYYEINPGGAEHQGIFILCNGRQSFKEFFRDKIIQDRHILLNLRNELFNYAEERKSFVEARPRSAFGQKRLEESQAKFDRMNSIYESGVPPTSESIENGLNDIYRLLKTSSYSKILNGIIDEYDRNKCIFLMKSLRNQSPENKAKALSELAYQVFFNEQVPGIAPNVIRYPQRDQGTIVYHKDLAYIIMEYIRGFSYKVEDFGYDYKFIIFSPEQANDLSNKIKAMYESRLIHPDLHIENIILLEDEVKIIDFGHVTDLGTLSTFEKSKGVLDSLMWDPDPKQYNLNIGLLKDALLVGVAYNVQEKRVVPIPILGYFYKLYLLNKRKLLVNENIDADADAGQDNYDILFETLKDIFMSNL